jgi:hypothetical protein
MHVSSKMPLIVRADGNAPHPLRWHDGNLYCDIAECVPSKIAPATAVARGASRRLTGPGAPPHPHQWDRSKYQDSRWCVVCGILEVSI